MTTKPGDVKDQSVTIWATQFQDEFRESHVYVALTDASYQGEFNKSNSEVVISQYNAGTGEDLEINLDNPASDTSCEFNPSSIDTQKVTLKVNRRAVSSREVCDMTEALTLVKANDPALRRTMAYEVSQVINKRAYASTVATSNTGSTASINAATLSALSKQADDLFWPTSSRILVVDSLYHKNLLDATILVDVNTSGNSDLPTIGGEFAQTRYGWTIVKDTSLDMKAQLNGGAGGVLVALTRGHLLWASPFGNAESRFKVSDQHGSRRFGSVMSMDQPYGVGLGNDGADKAIIIRSGS